MVHARSVVARLQEALVVVALAAIVLPGSARAERIVEVVEYYHAGLDHYFVTARPSEIQFLDGGALGGAWRRTGQSFQAWDADDGPANSVQVCRFYGTDQYRADGSRIGPNSHFYTADPNECDFVRTAWQSLAADGRMYPAWTFEDYAFRAIRPVNGVCPPGTIPLYRAYNNGAGGEANHRYSTNLALLQSMPGWTVEGIVMCLPGGPATGGTDAAECMIPVPGHSSVLRSSVTGITQRHRVGGTTSNPVVHTTIEDPEGQVESERTYSIVPGPGTRKTLLFGNYKTTLTAGGATIVTQIDDGQQLTLPMAPGESQTSSVLSVTGNYSIEVPGVFNCSQPITGRIVWRWEYLGIESVTVPAGTFSACRFHYYRIEELRTTCPPGFSSSAGTSEPVSYWFVPTIGIVRTSGQDRLEMVSHSP